MDSALAMLEQPVTKSADRVAYTVHETAMMLGVHYFSVYWLIQKNKIHACRALPGRILIPRSEIIRLLNVE